MRERDGWVAGRPPEASMRGAGFLPPAERPNVDGVRTLDTVKSEPSAVCAECYWSREGATGRAWLAIRAAARRHVASTGHPVLAGVRTSSLYGPEPGTR